MEIKFINISYKLKNINYKNINIRFNSNYITGLYGDNFETIPKLLKKELNYQGQILFNNKVISLNEKISYIKEIDKDTFLTKKVSDEFYLKKKNLNIKETEYLDKIVSALKMVGLNKKYLKRDINTLSKSEKKLLEISLELVSEPNIIIFNEPFLYLNSNYCYNIKKIILELKEKYQKTVIILSNDINVLYELCDELIIFKENNILISGKKSLVFKDSEFLEKNDIELPNIILFNKIALAYNKKIKACYDNDSLIKGVLSCAIDALEETKGDWLKRFKQFLINFIINYLFNKFIFFK